MAGVAAGFVVSRGFFIGVAGLAGHAGVHFVRGVALYAGEGGMVLREREHGVGKAAALAQAQHGQAEVADRRGGGELPAA